MENPILKSAQFAINYIVVPIHSKGVRVYMCWVMFPVYSQMIALQLLEVAFHYRWKDWPLVYSPVDSQ